VLINVECPICGNKYQLRPDMLGKRMRCTNPTCRAVFEVQESAPPPLQPTRPAARPLPDSAARPLAQQPTPQAKSPAASPSVPAPSLPAPSVPPPSLPAPQVADWATAPPPVQRPSASVSASTPAAAPDANAFTPAAPLPTTPPRPNQPRVSVPAHSPATVERAAPAQQQSSRPESSAPSEPPVDPLPPPVVRDYAEPAVDAEPSSDRLPLPEMRPAKRGGGRAVLLALVAVLLLALVGVGAGVYFLARPAGEVERFEQAKKDFESRKYTDAARSFAKLAEDFASHREEYRLLADLATLRGETDSVFFDPERAIAAYRAVRDHPADAANQTRHRIWIWEAAVQLVGKVTQRAEEQAAQKDFSAAATLAAQVEALLDELPSLPKVEQMQEQIDQLRQRHTALAQQIARGRALADLLGQLQALLNENPTQEKIDQGLALAQAAGFDSVPQVRRLLDDARRQVRTSVRFVQSPLPPITPPPEPSLTSLVVVPPLAGQAALGTEPRTTEASGPRSGTPSVVYAVARGVVYGLSGSDGRLLWMTRVGLDGATLPVTVPSSAVGREMTLLLVEAGTALRAVDPTTGAVQWQQPLGGTAVGRPLLVGRRVYVAVRDQRPGRAEHGKLYEFSVIDGHRIGWLETGQALAGGITRHGNTGLLFCPAESERVYVINVDHIEPDGQRRPQCIEVLETAHPAGSLRSELVVAGAELHGGDSETPELSWPRYLLLPQADGLNTMKLRCFALSPAQRQDPPTEIALPGWSWFTPHCDGERLALATDAGHLALLGINQPGNNDPPLFPLQPTAAPSAVQSAAQPFDTRPPQRCQVVRLDENTVWVLLDGQLSRRGKVFDPRVGPKFVELNKLPGLGSPLHAPQFSDDGSTIYLVTQLAAVNVCRITAVDAERLTIRWQRQLGLALVDEPSRLADGSWLLTDPSGCVHRVVHDPAKNQPVAYMLARPEPTALGQAYLLRAADDQSATLLLPAAPRDNTPGYRLIVRRFRLNGADLETDSAEVKLPTRLAGAPILTGQAVVLPLSDGTLHRLQRLGEQWRLLPGPSWRSDLASPDAPAFLAAVSDSEFLSTDGRDGLLRWSWPDGANYKLLGKEPYRHTARLNAVPVVLTAGNESMQILLTDVRGRVTLLKADPNGNEWSIERVWNVGRPSAAITAGPFVRPDADGVKWFGCITGHNRLVWFNPNEPGPAWSYSIPDQAGLVGPPQRLDDRLLLATQTGQLLTLDAKTGQPTGDTLTLAATMTPATTPVPLDAQRLLVPLTDCTVIFLPRPGLPPAAGPIEPGE
jgi:outer membrane protein assembly factor BamB